MLRVFSRIRKNRIEIQIREVNSGIEAQFTTTSLTSNKLCIYPTMLDGLEVMCGQPSLVPPDHSGGTHGWFCRYHYFRTMLRPTPDNHDRFAAAAEYDNDNIAFIIAQDRKRLPSDVTIAPFRGWHPLQTAPPILPIVVQNDEPQIYH